MNRPLPNCLSALFLLSVSVGHAQTTQTLTNADILVSGEVGGILDGDTAIVSLETFDAGETGKVIANVYTTLDQASWTFQQPIIGTTCVDIAYAMDGNTAVFGQVCDNFASFGVVSIYERDAAGQWNLQASLEQPQREVGQRFGLSVAVSGDTIAVGANAGGESNATGKVYIYSRNDDQWSLQAEFESDVGFGSFGAQVELDKDTLLVRKSSFIGQSGANLYTRDSNGAWMYQAFLPASEFTLEDGVILTTEITANDNLAPNTILRFYSKNENSNWVVVQQIDHDFQFLESPTVSGDRALLGFSNSEGWRDKVYHYQRNDGQWSYSGQIDTQNLEFGQSRVLVTNIDIDGDTVLLGTSNIPDNGSEPAKFTYIVTLDSQDTANCIDTDGDGWGWTGTESCVLSIEALCVDTDGDGWGWDGIKSCRITTAPVVTSSGCIDSDGDGFGWNGVDTCFPGGGEAQPVVDQSLVCIDSNGDGFGWTGTQSCHFDKQGNIVIL